MMTTTFEPTMTELLSGQTPQDVLESEVAALEMALEAVSMVGMVTLVDPHQQQFTDALVLVTRVLEGVQAELAKQAGMELVDPEAEQEEFEPAS